MQILVNPISVNLTKENDKGINPFDSPLVMRVIHTETGDNLGGFCVEFGLNSVSLGFKPSGQDRAYWCHLDIRGNLIQQTEWFLGNFNLVISTKGTVQLPKGLSNCQRDCPIAIRVDITTLTC